MRFRTRIFLAAFGVAALSLGVATTLVSWSLGDEVVRRIERDLVAQTRLTAELLSRTPDAEDRDLDDLADALGAIVAARVTLIARDGRVLGDSTLDGDGLAAIDNHGARPEVQLARTRGLGVVRRYSTTAQMDMLYAAVQVSHPDVAFARLALPLTDVAGQVATVRTASLVALAVALLGALGFAWVTSVLLSRRLQAMAAAARAVAAGGASRPIRDYGRDEIGSVSRLLDDSMQELGRRMNEIARDRALTGAILLGMDEGVVVVDAQGRVHMANEAARRLLELEGSPGGRHYLELIRHPDVTSRLAAALAGEAPGGVELTIGRGAERILAARAAPVAWSGGSGAVLVVHDITQLRRADRIRRDFVANVSHELRTPLTAIGGAVEALLDAAPAGDDARHFLEIVARQATRMERLVRDLLRLARLEAGQEIVERSRCAIGPLVAGVTSDLAPAIGARRQRVEVHVAPDAATFVADPTKMHDVLKNLLENAVNYGPEGGTIRVEATGEAGAVRIAVCDEGPGIPPADLERVFERFYRVDKARSPHPGGTGLGLAIVKHLVGLHGGTVMAANRSTGGARFTIVLPQASSPEALRE